jgi:hypothetical protein
MSFFTVACDFSDRLPARRPSAWTKGCLDTAAVTAPTAIWVDRRAGRRAPMKRKER